ncbi:MAG: PH domain-containing protein [Anaerolineae bacterium]|nr:PH domain-containing protein [Anaerolineae bacterium]
MDTQTFAPNRKYRIKLQIEFTAIALLVLLGGLFLAIPIGLEEGFGASLITMIVVGGLDVLWWAPAMLLAGPYYRSLGYEIQDEQAIVRVGIWTRSVKHVPYRTVTNITVKRDVLDRSLGLGTLEIQTAGMSGSSGGAEQSLVGLEDAQQVYDLVARALGRFRGSMAPTATEAEGKREVGLTEILAELRTIRRLLER